MTASKTFPHARKLSPALALLCLLLAGAQEARADTVQLSSPAQLTPGGTTNTYPGAPGSSLRLFFAQNVSGGGGTNNLQFGCNACTSFVRQDQGAGWQGAFPAGTSLITGNGNGVAVQFGGIGVSEFGAFVQFPGMTAVRLRVFDNFGPPLDFFATDRGDGLFYVGARTTGVINYVFISSDVPSVHGQPNFALGPVTFRNAPPEAALPEPGTLALLASGLAGAAGWRRRRSRRK